MGSKVSPSKHQQRQETEILELQIFGLVAHSGKLREPKANKRRLREATILGLPVAIHFISFVRLSPLPASTHQQTLICGGRRAWKIKALLNTVHQQYAKQIIATAVMYSKLRNHAQ